MAGAAFAQRMGSGVFTGISVTSAVIMSVVLDNFGWMGFKVHPASWPRIAGCALMIVGLWMTAEF
jgi:transporter family-2 protein